MNLKLSGKIIRCHHVSKREKKNIPVSLSEFTTCPNLPAFRLTSGFIMFESETSMIRHPELNSDLVSVMFKSTGLRIVQCNGLSVILKEIFWTC